MFSIWQTFSWWPQLNGRFVLGRIRQMAHSASGAAGMFFAELLDMNLPNYFLADLPPEATFPPAMISEACQTLKRNRKTVSGETFAASMVSFFVTLGENWFGTRNFLSKIRPGKCASHPLSRATWARISGAFQAAARENFRALFAQELGDGIDINSDPAQYSSFTGWLCSGMGRNFGSTRRGEYSQSRLHEHHFLVS